MTTTEASLPTEVWIMIFNNIRSFSQLVQCSLVNSRWERLTKAAMSNKHITLTSQHEALYFLNLLKENTTANQLIKYLTMMPQNQPPLGSFRQVMRLVITRNMKIFNGSVQGIRFFRVMVKAISGEGLAKFQNLKTIPYPWEYCTDYDELLNRLRNTLTEITLSFRSINGYSQPMHRWKTLQRLDRMTQLKALTFTSELHSIKEVEAVLANCGNLQQLTIHLVKYNLFSNTNFNRWMQMHVRQRDTLKTLKVIVGPIYNPHLIDYLIYKYPNIESIIVDKTDRVTESGVQRFQPPMVLHQIVDVLKKIERVPAYTLKCKVPSEEVNSIPSKLETNGYNVSIVGHYTITAMQSNSNQLSHSDTYLSVAEQLASLVPLDIS